METQKGLYNCCVFESKTKLFLSLSLYDRTVENEYGPIPRIVDSFFDLIIMLSNAITFFLFYFIETVDVQEINIPVEFFLEQQQQDLHKNKIFLLFLLLGRRVCARTTFFLLSHRSQPPRLANLAFFVCFLLTIDC